MYKRILMAIDPSHGSDQQGILKTSAHLAGESGAEFFALTVVEPIPASVEAEASANLAERSATLAMEELKAVVGNRPDIECVVRHGKPGTVITEFARQKGVDCIVLASHKPGLRDYFLGSTAGRVVRHAACSVHVMR